MVDLRGDVDSLANFQQNTPEFLNRLKQTGRPVFLTVNGNAELVVQDAQSYQRLLDLADRLETIHAVQAGLASADRGEGRAIDQVFDAFEEELSSQVEA